MRIISGGQTGADRGALYGALQAGYDIDGWAPLGWLAEDGTIPEKLSEHMRQAPSPEYPMRTEYNIRDSDATLLLHHGKLGIGSMKTVKLALKLRKPLATVNLKQEYIGGKARCWASSTLTGWVFTELLLAEFFKKHVNLGTFALVLNVAGPRESHAPGLEDDACWFVRDALKRYLR